MLLKSFDAALLAILNFKAKTLDRAGTPRPISALCFFPPVSTDLEISLDGHAQTGVGPSALVAGQLRRRRADADRRWLTMTCQSSGSA